jgi:hypothetical protein
MMLPIKKTAAPKRGQQSSWIEVWSVMFLKLCVEEESLLLDFDDVKWLLPFLLLL